MRFVKHAFPVVAHFDWAIGVTMSAPVERLVRLVGPGLALDAVDGHGFVAIACVQTRRLRPAGCPARLGMDFLLVGYRLFVTRNQTRGLQILGSETDRRLMAMAGRAFTHYGYRHVSARVETNGSLRRISTSAGMRIAVRDDRPELPQGSVFANWDAARRFAGPAMYTFASAAGGRSLVSVRGTRAHWKPRPIAVIDACAPFLEALLGQPAAPAAAFLVEDIEYRWDRGVYERLR